MVQDEGISRVEFPVKRLETRLGQRKSSHNILGLANEIGLRAKSSRRRHKGKNPGNVGCLSGLASNWPREVVVYEQVPVVCPQTPFDRSRPGGNGHVGPPPISHGHCTDSQDRFRLDSSGYQIWQFGYHQFDRGHSTLCLASWAVASRLGTSSLFGVVIP